MCSGRSGLFSFIYYGLDLLMVDIQNNLYQSEPGTEFRNSGKEINCDGFKNCRQIITYI
jgi:hypothetical protein